MNFARRITSLSLAVIALGAITRIAKADTTIYTDGPAGNYFYSSIDTGYETEDSFNVSFASTLTSITYSNVLGRGNQQPDANTAISVDWAIVGAEGSQTPICGSCSGIASLTGVNDFLQVRGYSVFDETFSLPDIDLPVGTYWLELTGEKTTLGEGIDAGAAWDMSGGPSDVWVSDAGDHSGDNCPFPSGPGSCSNAFTIYGTVDASSATPEPSSLALLGSGLTLLGAEIRRRRKYRPFCGVQ